MTSTGFIKSQLLEQAGVKHAFGLKKYSLIDYLIDFEIPSAKFFKTNQMHGDNIVVLKSVSDKDVLIEADAFVTSEEGVVPFVRTADCVPILLSDPVKGIVAAVHAGWRGTAKEIVAKTVAFMSEKFGSSSENICAAIGPAIGASCFEVGAEAVEGLKTFSRFIIPKDDNKFLVDLKKINSAQLLSCGVSKIDTLDICNHCDTRFASYRRDRYDSARQVSFICR